MNKVLFFWISTKNLSARGSPTRKISQLSSISVFGAIHIHQSVLEYSHIVRCRDFSDFYYQKYVLGERIASLTILILLQSRKDYCWTPKYFATDTLFTQHSCWNGFDDRNLLRPLGDDEICWYRDVSLLPLIDVASSAQGSRHIVVYRSSVDRTASVSSLWKQINPLFKSFPYLLQPER